MHPTALEAEQVFFIKDPLWWKGRRIHEPPLAAKLNHGKGDDVSTGDVVASIGIVLRKVSGDIGITGPRVAMIRVRLTRQTS